ncbi:MAG: acpP 2 [Schlesneria sp.]|nr:acpP 2 [Schlesneria sp.]
MMSTKFNRDQIHAGAREDLATCLGIEPEEIELDARFFHDLGGESIDLLDFGFRSERRYGIRSPFQRLTGGEGWQFDEQGQVAESTLVRLQTEFPQIDWPVRLAGISLESFRDLLTIELMVELLYFAQFENAQSGVNH